MRHTCTVHVTSRGDGSVPKVDNASCHAVEAFRDPKEELRLAVEAANAVSETKRQLNSQSEAKAKAEAKVELRKAKEDVNVAQGRVAALTNALGAAKAAKAKAEKDLSWYAREDAALAKGDAEAAAEAAAQTADDAKATADAEAAAAAQTADDAKAAKAAKAKAADAKEGKSVITPVVEPTSSWVLGTLPTYTFIRYTNTLDSGAKVAYAYVFSKKVIKAVNAETGATGKKVALPTLKNQGSNVVVLSEVRTNQAKRKQLIDGN